MKWLVLSLLAALLLLQYRLWMSNDGVHEVWRLGSAVSAQQSENSRLAELQQKVGAMLAAAGVKPGELLSEQLIADRREEAAREDRESHEQRDAPRASNP